LPSSCGERLGYKVEVDPEGITGWIPPIPVSPSSLDEWVTKMVLRGPRPRRLDLRRLDGDALRRA